MVCQSTWRWHSWSKENVMSELPEKGDDFPTQLLPIPMQSVLLWGLFSFAFCSLVIGQSRYHHVAALTPLQGHVAKIEFHSVIIIL